MGQYSQIFKLCMGVCLGGGVRTGESTCVVAQLVLSQEGKRQITAGSNERNKGYMMKPGASTLGKGVLIKKHMASGS